MSQEDVPLWQTLDMPGACRGRQGGRILLTRRRAIARGFREQLAWCSRKLAGWAVADHMRTSLVEDALKAALADRGSLRGAIFHADHGSVYTSKDYARLCGQLGVIQSLGAVGTSADNALAEAFNATVKRETLAGAATFTDAASCRRVIFRWAVRYNTRRRHSYLGHMAPNTYESHYAATIPEAA